LHPKVVHDGVLLMSKDTRKNVPAGDLLDRTLRLLRQSGLRARKGLGQNFLIDGAVLEHIISAAGLDESDTVIEVGPGLGVLTAGLAERAGRVIAVELDDRLAALLKRTLAPEKVGIVNGNILKITPSELLGDFPSRNYKVVANLPYYITSPVLRHFLEAEIQPEIMVVMVQKEVAEEIAAAPGKMSLLSIGVQLYGEPEIVEIVPARCFYPAPEVDSAVLKVTPREEPVIEKSGRESFFSLVRAGFSAARKQLPNSLAQGLGVPKEGIIPLLEKAGIEPKRRAETLSLEEWARLWRLYGETG
jgi:16S rRNA (adenine1518-N6/adenine1519-N6)-dimethyltransferase